MTEPIRQDIRTDYDGKPVEDAARDIKAMGEATQAAGQKTEQAGNKVRTHEQRIRDMKQELAQLTREQQRSAGTGDQASAADEKRQARIDRLSRALAVHQQAQRSASESVERHIVTEEKAERVERTREQRLRGLRDRLDDLAREQVRYDRELERGNVVGERATQAHARRERQMTRIGAVLRDEQRVQDRASEAVRGHTTQLAGLAAAARGVLPALGASAGILGAYRLIKAELDAIIDRQEKAFRTQVDLATAQRQVIKNLPGASSEDIDRVFAAATDISIRRGVPQPQVLVSLAAALSGTAGDIPGSIAAVDLASQFSSEDPGQIAGVAGGIADISSSIGTKDTLEAFGFQSTVAGLSRVANPERQAKNIPPAIAGLTSAELTPAEAGALFAALTNASKDVTGEQSGTAAISFANRVNDLFRELGRPERGGAAIRALQAEPELARQFIEGGEIVQGGKRVRLPELTAEAKSINALRDLLQKPGSEIARNFTAFQGRFGDSDRLRSTAQTQLSELSRGTVQETAEIARRLETSAGALQSIDTAGGRAGAVRSGIIDVLKASGEGALATKIDNLQFNLGGGLNDEAVTAAIQLLRRRRGELLAPAPPFRGGQFGGFSDQTPEVTQLGTQRAATLEDLIGRLETIGDVPASPPAITVYQNNGTQLINRPDPGTAGLEDRRPPN